MDNWANKAQEYLNTEKGKKLMGKKDDIARIADSPDGQRVKNMLEKNGGLDRAIESGDTAAVQAAIRNILNTKEGARLAQQLKDLMK